MAFLITVPSSKLFFGWRGKQWLVPLILLSLPTGVHCSYPFQWKKKKSLFFSHSFTHLFYNYLLTILPCMLRSYRQRDQWQNSRSQRTHSWFQLSQGRGRWCPLGSYSWQETQSWLFCPLQEIWNFRENQDYSWRCDIFILRTSIQKREISKIERPVLVKKFISQNGGKCSW